jgi:hypothetical protein
MNLPSANHVPDGSALRSGYPSGGKTKAFGNTVLASVTPA